MNNQSRTKILLFSLFAILSVFTLGCESLYGPLKPIEGNIIFNFREDVWHNTKGLSYCDITLKLYTEMIYGCCNYSIIYEEMINGSVIIVDILGIYKPSICLTALGPASNYLLLEETYEGNYTLIFSYQGVSDIYSLNITKSGIVVVPECTIQFTEHGPAP